MAKVEVIKRGSENEKNLILVRDVREISYGDILFIKTDMYYKEEMRKQYKFETQREFNDYKNYFKCKVRDKQCYKVRNNEQ